jgi:predicted anti-sigma-YlaC factor YlaD
METMRDKRYSETPILRRWQVFAAATVLLTWLSSTGCSYKEIAIRKLGDALSEGGTTYASDDDPELIKGAVPFGLKLMETLLSESPRHKGLLLATCRGFTQYGYAFVQQEADEVEERDVEKAMEIRARARRLYLRARNYGIRGLEVVQPGFEKMARNNPRQGVQTFKSADVPLLYWTAVSWAAAISVAKDSADLIADLPVVEALIDRALELDEGFDGGAVHSFLITYEMNRETASGDPEERARRHFKKAMEFSGGKLCGPLVTLAESVSLPKQDKAEFRRLLQQALEMNPDSKPEWRLANIVMQRRARWLLSHSEKLFVD